MDSEIAEGFKAKILEKAFPCVAAKDALQKDNIDIFVAGHLGCPKDDADILQFIYGFTEKFRQAPKGFYSAVVIFPHQSDMDEKMFEACLFQRLKALRTLDAVHYRYDSRVDEDPQSENFSFSLMEEAFFIVGLHPNSSRPARQFPYTAVVFNPHVQFDKMRAGEQYDKMKAIVRKRDEAYSGSINPMLTDFGKQSEVFQYSGRNYKEGEGCPFHM